MSLPPPNLLPARVVTAVEGWNVGGEPADLREFYNNYGILDTTGFWSGSRHLQLRLLLRQGHPACVKRLVEHYQIDWDAFIQDVKELGNGAQVKALLTVVQNPLHRAALKQPLVRGNSPSGQPPAPPMPAPAPGASSGGRPAPNRPGPSHSP